MGITTIPTTFDNIKTMQGEVVASTDYNAVGTVVNVATLFRNLGYRNSVEYELEDCAKVNQRLFVRHGQDFYEVEIYSR